MNFTFTHLRIACVLLLLICAVNVKAQNVVYVDSSITTSGAGTSWITAYKTLQEALTAAANNATIQQVWVKKGTYYPTAAPSGSDSRDYTFLLKNNLAIFGGFAGTESALNQRSPSTNPTTLSGDIGTAGDNSDNCYHVLISVNNNSTAVLDGFRITAGNANNSSSPLIVGSTSIYRHNAGGMINSSSSPSISNCAFVSNSGIYGGGMTNTGICSPSITNCTFISNNGSYGGALCNSQATPAITNCTIFSNSSTRGGGMTNISSGTPVIKNTIIWANTGFNPGIDNNGGNATVTYSLVQNGYSGTGNLNIDPSFVNSSNPAGADGNYGNSDDGLRLQSGSPALDAGINSGVPAGITTDITGAARIQNTTVDMGAYEGAVIISAPIVYVDGNISASGVGISWATAYKTLQEAMIAASNIAIIQQIWVKKGTYYPTAYPAGSTGGSTPRDYAFFLKSNLGIYGGFIGTETALNQRNPGANPTVLSGDIGTAGDNSDNCYHVIVSVNNNNTAVLDGFKITGGNANSSSYMGLGGTGFYQNSGGGMVNASSSPSITNCTFVSNSGTFGGGMANTSINCSPAITNCTFVSNSSSYGAGLYNSQSFPTITNCTITSNSSVNHGGGILNTASANPTITNTIIWGNTGYVPGIYNDGSSATITYSLVQSGYSGTGNLNTDPLFINSSSPSGADGIYGTADDGLKLQPGSPALDAGINSAVPSAITADITGATRIQHTTVDMGTYENAPILIFVDSSIAVSGAGITWAKAYKTLQEALADAGNYTSIQQIWVKKGTYYPTAYPAGSTGGSTGRDYAFTLKNNLAIYGGFAGTETALSQRSPRANLTSLNGDIGIAGNNSDNCYHVIVSAGNNNTAVLDGFRIINGNGNGAGNIIITGFSLLQNRGGGMYNTNSSPTIANCTYTTNFCSTVGGGMYNETYSSPAIANCTFAANNAGPLYGGGGMHNNNYSSPTIVNSIFSANTASAGGGLYNINTSSPTITNCTFCSNTGGGIFNGTASTAVCSNTIVWGNTGGSNPGIYNSGGSATVTYSLIQGGYSGTANLDIDPLFVNAANPAGPDGIYGTADDGLRLFFCSPAINTGSGTVAGTDIVGAPRTIGTQVDRGAYEKQSPALPSSSQAALSNTLANATNFVKTCENGTWTYYAIPNNADSVGFAIDWGASNTAAKNAATLSITTDAANTAQVNASAGTWAMRRYWNVDLHGQLLASPVKVRFYYAAADTVAMRNAAVLSGLSGPKTLKWFKTVGTPYSPSLITPTNTGNSFQVLVPAAAGSDNNAAWVQFDNITSFSGGTAMISAGGATPLPVTLLSFDAKKGSNGHSAVLAWEVAEEQQLEGYEVERSTDAQTFRMLAKVKAAGTNTYEFIDEVPAPGINYYRLGMSSSQGTIRYSVIRQLSFEAKGTVMIWPNPVDQQFTIRNTNADLNGTDATILDMSGRIIMHVLVDNEQVINVSSWPVGIYSLKLVNGYVIRIEKR